MACYSLNFTFFTFTILSSLYPNLFFNFNILLTVHLNIFIININQLDALNFIISLFQASTCFEHVLIVRRAKLYYTVSGIITPIGGRPVHRLREDSSQSVHGRATYRCDDTRDCIIQFCPPDDEHMCSKHVEA